MIHKVEVPILDVNDEYVVLGEWYVKEGHYINKGDSLCAIETSKNVSDLYAETSGYVKHLRYEIGEQIPVSGILCYIVDSPDSEIVSHDIKEQKVISTDPSSALQTTATTKAINLARELGVDLSDITKKGIIREKDVLALHKSKNSAAPQWQSVVEDSKKAGSLNKEIVEILKHDKSFVQLSSELKKLFYKLNGAEIGDNVFIGKGSLIIANKLLICDNVTIGEDTYIEADEVILGKMVKIGNHCNVVSGSIRIGEVTTITDHVTVDVSGGKTAESRIVIGSQCLLANEVYLNSCRTIELGNNVALSPRAMIYTHSYWQSVLDGYPASLSSVTIEDNAWIGSSAQILPGVKIGDGSIVMSNSLVTSDVTPFTMVGGVPADVIKQHLKKELTDEAKNRILISLLDEFLYLLKEKECKTEVKRDDQKVEYTINLYQRKQFYKIILALTFIAIDINADNTIYIGLNLKQHDSQHASIFDIGTNKIYGPNNIIVNELRNFLRRKGIVFNPIYWRYDFRNGI